MLRIKFETSKRLFLIIRPPPELLPVLVLLEQYMTPTLDAALLCSSRAGSDLGRKSDRFEEHITPTFVHNKITSNTKFPQNKQE